MFLENENQPIISHSSYDLARPMDHHHHNHLHHHHQTATNQLLGDHQDDSEGRSSSSSPTSSYRDLSGCEDFDLKIPKLSSTGSVTGNGGNNKEQKPKKHKCKHCGLECTEKVQYWKHIRTHIKPEQLLECPNCEFATDLKHHYEYHLLNHTGAKPFTCPDCDYKCVSKSMLQSHLKSHSNVFQFQCFDCGYASKYMHSLKQHLKKRDHRPATPLNPDGTPNPDIVIDVVGNRRGPRQNKKQNRHNPYQQQHHQQQPMVVSSSQDDGVSNGGPYSMQQLLQMPTSGIAPAVYPTSAESYMYSMITKRTMEMADYQAEYLAIKNNNNNSTAVDDKMDMQQQQQQYPPHHQYTHHIMQYHPEDMVQVEVGGGSGGGTPEPAAAEAPATVVEMGPLNLSKDSVTPRAAGSSRRKGIACKLERPAAEPPKVPVVETVVQMDCTESKTTEVMPLLQQQPTIRHELVQQPQKSMKQESVQHQQQQQQPIRQESIHQQQSIRQEPMQQQQQQQPTKHELILQQQHNRLLSSPEKEDETHVCHHCDIIFKENIMYSMHMGFHSFRDPFACNLCGEITADKFSFFAHIARVPHS